MFGGLWYTYAALVRESPRMFAVFTGVSNNILATEIELATTTEKSPRPTAAATTARGNHRYHRLKRPSYAPKPAARVVVAISRNVCGQISVEVGFG